MTSASAKEHFQSTGLYDPANEHDACGVGFVAHIKGHKTHAIVTQALRSWKTWTTGVLWARMRSWVTVPVS